MKCKHVRSWKSKGNVSNRLAPVVFAFFVCLFFYVLYVYTVNPLYNVGVGPQ